MNEQHTHQEIKRHVRGYLIVFGALLLGTGLTVGAYYLHINSVVLTVALALFIASIKAFLVAGFFMHLISEKKAIYATLLATGVLFLALMFLTVWSMHDFPAHTIMKQ